jgi:hypothetical protein
MINIVVPKGDKGFNFAFTVTNSAGTAYNLTGYTIKLKMWNPDIPDTLLINSACSIVVAANGTCVYIVGATDFAITGFYYAEIELTKTDIIESTEPFSIEVTESA